MKDSPFPEKDPVMDPPDRESFFVPGTKNPENEII